jgi:hypothetical protein
MPEKARLQSELAGVATGLGASLLLEPRDELGDGKGLGERARVARAGGRLRWLRSGGLRSGGGSGGSRRGGAGSLARSRSSGTGSRSGGLGGCSRGAAGASTVPDLGAGDSVRGGAAVHVEKDTGVGGRVGLGHVGAGGGERDGTTRDLDLSATVVELCALRAVALMETDHLGADKVLAVLNVGKGDGDLALVVDELLDSPDTVVQALLEDLGPDSSLTVGGGLGHVDHDGSHVRSSDRLVSITRAGLRVVVVPLEGDVGASSNVDKVGGGLAAVADHGSGGDIEDGVVAVGRRLDSEVLSLVLSVDDDGLEGGVASDELGSGESECYGGPHVGFWCGDCGSWWSESIVRDEL